jgi:hypothetical protein
VTWRGTFGNEPKSDEETALAAYVKFILNLYKAQPIQGSHVHGKKGGAFVHVGAVDAPVTIAQIEDASAEAQRLGGKELHVLGWEFEMGLHDPITRIEALNFRSLRDVDVRVGPFEILVGPNGSGKSSLLDVIALLGDILRVGPAKAILGDPRLSVSQRSPDPGQLCWMRKGHRFELAIEAQIPAARKARMKNGGFERCRYEVALNVKEAISLEAETLWLIPGDRNDESGPRQQQLFPFPRTPRASMVRPSGSKTPKGWKKVVAKTGEAGNDYFMAETSGWNNPFRLGPEKSALANLPEDEERFPAATWFKRLLMEGVQRIVLSSEAMRRPSAPGLPIALQPDGSNLPWIVGILDDKTRGEWVAHAHRRRGSPTMNSCTSSGQPYLALPPMPHNQGLPGVLCHCWTRSIGLARRIVARRTRRSSTRGIWLGRSSFNLRLYAEMAFAGCRTSVL